MSVKSLECPRCLNRFNISQEQYDQFIEGSAQRPWRGRFVPVHMLCDRCERIGQMHDNIEQMRDDLDKRLSG